ncbi:MAG: tyrosine-type recombinase/integrase [Actinobacteria bacterium]|nr:tyrosine-type recombinase/integrase [Actinomycetota bacterium]
MAYLCKRGSRRNWYVGVWLRSQQRKKFITTGTTNRKQAEKMLQQVQAAESIAKSKSKALEIIYEENLMDQGLINDLNEFSEIQGQLTLEEASKRFLKSKENAVATGTLKSYAVSLKDLQAALSPGTPVINIKRGDFDRLVAYLIGHYNISTTNIRLRSIRAFVHWLLEFEYLSKVPFKIKQLKNDKLPKFLTPDEITGIYAQVTDPVIRAAFKVYEHTGIRLGELFTSELDGNFLKIKGKGNKWRIVPLPRDVRDDFLVAVAARVSTYTITHQFTDCWRKSLLQRHPEKLADGGLNEMTKKQIRDMAFEILGEKYAKANNIEILTEADKREARSNAKTLHSFRHSFALKTWLKSGDIYFVKKLLGHSTVSVTEVYMRFPTEYLKQVFQT